MDFIDRVFFKEIVARNKRMQKELDLKNKEFQDKLNDLGFDSLTDYMEYVQKYRGY